MHEYYYTTVEPATNPSTQPVKWGKDQAQGILIIFVVIVVLGFIIKQSF